jgi:3D (Asp-Asp-Asp) domain-containing protein
MKTLLLISVLVTATIYHAVPEQTNEDYLTTASLKKINPDNPAIHRWIAVSRDLEKLGFTMGKQVRICGTGNLDGVWTIEDRMNKRWTKRIDFLVNTTRKYGKWGNVSIELLHNPTKMKAQELFKIPKKRCTIPCI